MSNYLDVVESEEVEEQERIIPKFLAGFNVGTKSDKDNKDNVVSSAVPVSQYHWEKDEVDLRLVKANRHYLQFFISTNVEISSSPIGFDPPVISSSLAICSPVITNHASLGGEFNEEGKFTRKDRLSKKKKDRLAKKKRK